MLAGEPFSDHPTAVSPVIAALARAYNDRLDRARRQDLLAVAAAAVGTAADADEVEVARLRHLEAWARGRSSRPLRRGAISLAARAGDLDRVAVLAVRALGRVCDAAHRDALALFDQLAALGDWPAAAAPAPPPAERPTAHV